MVALFVTLDIVELNKLGLNINEYLNILKIKHDEEDKSFPYEIDHRFVMRLVRDEFIEIDTMGSEKSPLFKLGSEGIKIFEGEDLFEEFYKLFPNRVETNIGYRAISAVDPYSISGKNTHDIWRRITKNKPNLQGKIIDGLKRELEHKRANNSMAYLQGIDTWLRQATWEKWEDIPDKKGSTGYTKL